MTFSPGDQWLYAAIGCCAAAILWVVIGKMLPVWLGNPDEDDNG